jgi:Uma2 family endonuclease
MSASDAVPKRLTIDEYRALPNDDRYRCELVRGYVVREPRPNNEHGFLVMKLGHYLLEFVEANRAGMVVCESGFVLEHSPPTVRGPDVAFIARARLLHPLAGYVEAAPDIAVEVLSPSNRARDMRAKVAEYFAAGARLVWVVDPRLRTVTVHTSARDWRVLSEDEELDGGAVLPGFRLELRRLFAY